MCGGTGVCVGGWGREGVIGGEGGERETLTQAK